jgi:hypothetical protein
MAGAGARREPESATAAKRQALILYAQAALSRRNRSTAMIRLSILAGAAGLALAGAAAAQPADPNYQAQLQDNQARQQQYQDQLKAYRQKQEAYDAQREAYARQRAGYRSDKDAADAQRRLWLQGLAAYEARYGVGSYDEYARAHPDVTTTVITPAGRAESRSSTTVIETPAR